MTKERDFRTIKTGLLELCPTFLRKVERIEGHALVTLLALKLVRAVERCVAPLGLTVEDVVARLGRVRNVVPASTNWPSGACRTPSRPRNTRC